MVIRKLETGVKGKPRGRAFQKGNIRGQNRNNLLGTTGHKSRFEGGTIDPALSSVCKEEKKEKTTSIVSEIYNKEIMDLEPQKNIENENPLELVESIDFKNGSNTLTIRFSKKQNRMFRIQIFLNHETEIRPVTYNGSSTGYSFWNLLKGAMKK